MTAALWLIYYLWIGVGVLIFSLARAMFFMWLSGDWSGYQSAVVYIVVIMLSIMCWPFELVFSLLVVYQFCQHLISECWAHGVVTGWRSIRELARATKGEDDE